MKGFVLVKGNLVTVSVKGMQPGVYILRYLPSGAAYVGASSRCVRNRLLWHRAVLRSGKHSCEKLQELWDESVPQDWEFELISEDPSLEDFYMNEEVTPLNTVFSGQRKWTPATRAKLKESAKRVGADPEERERRRQRALQQHQNNPGFAHKNRGKL